MTAKAVSTCTAPFGNGDERKYSAHLVTEQEATKRKMYREASVIVIVDNHEHRLV